MKKSFGNVDNIDAKYEVNLPESRYQKYSAYNYKEAKKKTKARKHRNLKYDEEEDNVQFTDDKESYVPEGAIESIVKADNLAFGDCFIRKSTHPKVRAVKGRKADHRLGNSTKSQYSDIHGTSGLFVCFPKDKVMSEVPESHKIIDKMYSDQHTTIDQDNATNNNNSTVEIIALDVTEGSLDKNILEQKFGKAYVEGRTYPRCFAIFPNQVKSSSPMRNNIEIIRDNIVIIAEIRSDVTTEKEQERFSAVPVHLKVFNAKSGSLKFLLEQTKLKDIFDFVYVIECIMHSCFPYDVIYIKDPHYVYTPIPEVIQKFVKWKTRTVIESEVFDLVFNSLSDTGPAAINESLTVNYVQFDELACLVCYAKLSPPTPCNVGSVGAYLRSDEGAALLSCCHWLCKDCWKHYLDIKINEGIIAIECPFTGCKNAVDIVTCLSFSSHSNVAKYLRMKFESVVQRDPAIQWCPGCEKAVLCEKVKKMNAENVFNDIPFVSCSCKRKWCFSCQNKPHWPISCDIYNKYKEIQSKEVAVDTLFDEHGIIYKTEVKIRHCPSCKTPINKTAGCSHMRCTCGQRFCWECGQHLLDQHNLCVRQQTETLIFSSLDVVGEYSQLSIVKKALEYQFKIRTILEIETKLEIHPPVEGSKLALLKKAFDLQRDCYSVLECVALALTKSKSINFNLRLIMFLDKMDVLFEDFIMTLKDRKLEIIKYKKLSSLIRATEDAMLNLKEFGI